MSEAAQHRANEELRKRKQVEQERDKYISLATDRAIEINSLQLKLKKCQQQRDAATQAVLAPTPEPTQGEDE